jgi:hypothetical protein
MNDVTVLWEGEGQGFYDNFTKASVKKSVTRGEGVSIKVQNCVTSFMDDPLWDLQRWFLKSAIVL